MKPIKHLSDATIDLRHINDRTDEYIKMGILRKESIFERLSYKHPILNNILVMGGVVFFIWAILLYIPVSNASEVQNNSIQDNIRIGRLSTCQEAYINSGINKRYIHGQIPAVRCATYMTLIYAFESNYGTSSKCINNKNCFGMKGNGRDHKAGFIKFISYKEGREWFANRYFKWHYKKNTDTFVNNWSETDVKVYQAFVKKNYWKIYKQLDYLYFNY